MKSSAKMCLKLMHTSLLDTCGLWFHVECTADRSRWSVQRSGPIRRTRATRKQAVATPQAQVRATQSVVSPSRPSRSHRGHR